MENPSESGKRAEAAADTGIRWLIVSIEYAIIASLLLVAGIVLVRTVVDFLSSWGSFPQSVVAAIDGILVVIILLDIAHTVFGHLRASVFPVRPFLVIGILAGVRDILSASAHLTLSGPLTQVNFNNTLISLGVGVGVVVFLLLGLLVLRFSAHRDEQLSD
ncbi:MAG TPA: phosphate-starvation-inducible PsiE family protein [Acidimicrobiales bacterium]|nr:phosphate-starvation-inducible PsiE family protein [Acidimicrobiales bacterium]